VLERLRRNLTYANVMATIAVFLVLAGGTAFAATEMLAKNSVGTQQIKKEAVTPAKLSKAAKATLTGPQGATGVTGPTGPQGSKGERGDAGEKGESASSTPVLLSGETEFGVWGAAAERSNYGVAAINFVPRLQGPVPSSNVKFLNEGETSPECPGFRSAVTGYLCVYTEYTAGGMEFRGFDSGFDGSERAESAGILVYLWTPPKGLQGANIIGNWAYTAP
jgi:hypothetical protein